MGGAPRPQGGPASELQAREDTERTFLALCIASPQEGAQMLETLDVEEHFSSPLCDGPRRGCGRGAWPSR